MKKLMIIAMFASFIYGMALAEDIQPPWWRGQWSTTLQGWEFSTPVFEHIKPDWPGPLDEGPPYIPGYLPSTEIIVVEPGPGMDWIDVDTVSGRQGIWPLSGYMDVIVDNHEPPNEFKWVWLQITWRSQDGIGVPIFSNLDPEPDPDYLPRLVERYDFGDGWFEDTYEWRIYPNPVDERFTIEGTIDVDELVIDTWCIPEPATLALLGLGGLALLRRGKS